MTQITHDNHFVPQLYLKQWSEDGLQILTYRILVSHENVPEWELRPIRGIAYHRDLYTSIENGDEIDGFEKWIEENYEQPAVEAIQKVVDGKRLKSADWECLALFLAAQDVRTPTNYLESMKRWKETLPELLETTLKESVKKLEKLQKGEYVPPSQSPFETEIDFKTKVTTNKDKGTIEANILTGRRLWIAQQKFLLSNTAKVLPTHKWSIVEPAHGYEWLTSDHPVIRLNYYREGNYDLKGGWGNKGANLFMPLSPKHLLFTQIGDEFPERMTFSVQKTQEIQRILSQRALQWIFARKQIENISEYRPRHIDPVAFQEEKEHWETWHRKQSSAENRYDE